MSPVATVYDAMGERPASERPKSEQPAVEAGLFDDAVLRSGEQVAAVEAALAAVNALVALQFQLTGRVLQCAVNAQAELYRARHAATQVDCPTPVDLFALSFDELGAIARDRNHPQQKEADDLLTEWQADDASRRTAAGGEA